MATIAENLQILKDSTDAIKQAIIDKGGNVSGDISTWAGAISGISGGINGGGSDEEYVFTGTLSRSGSTVTITGNLNKFPDNAGGNYLLALGWVSGRLCYDFHFITNTGPYTLTVDFTEPITSEIPAICILNRVSYTYTIIPVTFNKQLSTNPD